MIDTKTQQDEGLWPSSIDRTQARDTGMAATLICLIVAAVTGKAGWTYGAIATLVLNMTIPMAYKPLGFLWFGLSRIMGAVVSKVLLSFLFFVMVTPMGRIRRLMGKDTMRLRQFKDGGETAFITRDHTYVANDVEQPF